MFAEHLPHWAPPSLLPEVLTPYRCRPPTSQMRKPGLCAGPREDVFCGASVSTGNLVQMCHTVLGPVSGLAMGREDALPFSLTKVLGAQACVFLLRARKDPSLRTLGQPCCSRYGFLISRLEKTVAASSGLTARAPRACLRRKGTAHLAPWVPDALNLTLTVPGDPRDPRGLPFCRCQRR